ncbi:hypothetical protein D3C76_1232070 [compost metagenome]
MAQVVAIGRLLAVHQADEGFAADVGRARAVAPLVAGQHARFAPHCVIGLVAAITGRIAHGVERQERLLRPGAVAGEAVQRMHFEIHRPGTVGDHVVFVDPIRQVNAIQALGKQVDGRGAERQELRSADAAFQARIVTVEQHDQLQFLTVATLDRAAQLGEVDKQETVGQGEVFLQQAIALEGPRHHRQRGVGIIEAT